MSFLRRLPAAPSCATRCTESLASLHFVSFVCFFDEETPINLINLVQPDVLVKGADYKPENIVGYDVVINRGGIVETIEFLPGFSTTNIINRIKEIC